MIRIGIIGFGYWGPNLLRNFSIRNEAIVTHIADLRQDPWERVKKLYPSIRFTTSTDEVLRDNEIDAVIIATPVYTHYDIARKALLCGKHVLVEKPMTSSSENAMELIRIADKEKKILMVDHTYLYTGAVVKIKALIEDGKIGALRYFDSTRINLGLFQQDINVLWDLAPHDISILLYLVPEKPVSVQATGISHTGNGMENIAYMTVNYQNDMIAHFNCSWTSPVKIRQILIGGDKKMIVFNDMEPTEKVKIYDTGYHIRTDEDRRKILVDYRTGDIFTPKLEMQEALANVASDFINSILKATAPRADAITGMNVVRILEASSQSLKNKGAEVML